MAKKTEITDDDGNLIPEIDPASDVGQIIYLLEYARKRGFVVGPMVQVGAATVQVQDPATARRVARQGAPDRDDADDAPDDFKTLWKKD